MRSPGVTVRPIRLLNGEHDVNEVWFENVRVPLENLVGEENRGWTYAKLLLSHERTSIAEVGLAKRRFRSLLGLARDEGALDDRAFCHQVAVLQADIIALEVLVLRSLSASGKKHNALDVAGLLKLRGSEVQQRCTELMMLAAGPNSLPRTLPSGAPGLREPQPSESVVRESLASTYFHCRATSIYGGSNEVQRNILAQALMG